MICPYYNVNKFKGRKSSNQIVNKTLLVSNAESIAETCLLFASKAFSFKTRAIALAIDRTLVILFCGEWKIAFFNFILRNIFLNFLEIFYWYNDKRFTGFLVKTLLVKYLLFKCYNWINSVYTGCSTVNCLCNIYHVARASEIYCFGRRFYFFVLCVISM